MHPLAKMVIAMSPLCFLQFYGYCTCLVHRILDNITYLCGCVFALDLSASPSCAGTVTAICSTPDSIPPPPPHHCHPQWEWPTYVEAVAASSWQTTPPSCLDQKSRVGISLEKSICSAHARPSYEGNRFCPIILKGVWSAQHISLQVESNQPGEAAICLVVFHGRQGRSSKTAPTHCSFCAQRTLPTEILQKNSRHNSGSEMTNRIQP